MGALHYQPQSISSEDSCDGLSNEVEISPDRGSISLIHKFCDNADTMSKTEYRVHQAGVLRDVKIVDTTGAGDAFIGGYLMAKLASNAPDPVQFALEFGSFVGGRKLQGPGARSALPKGADVDKSLGNDEATVKEGLKNLLSSFNNMEEVMHTSTSSR
jgi:hypothetical protein